MILLPDDEMLAQWIETTIGVQEVRRALTLGSPVNVVPNRVTAYTSRAEGDETGLMMMVKIAADAIRQYPSGW